MSVLDVLVCFGCAACGLSSFGGGVRVCEAGVEGAEAVKLGEEVGCYGCTLFERKEGGVRVVAGFGEDAFVSFPEVFSQFVRVDPSDVASFRDCGVNGLSEVEGLEHCFSSYRKKITDPTTFAKQLVRKST